MDELKPCPFCGHLAHVFSPFVNEDLYNCGCTNLLCSVCPHLVLSWETELGAINAWNNRTATTEEGDE